MRRLRWALGLMAAALMLLVSLLVERAFEHTRLQQLVRHEAVARRVFDEMERALTELLRQEEERAYDQYRYFYEPDGSLPGGGLLRSPLAGLPEDPFILGYFQIDPDGSLHSPLMPRTDERGRLEPGWHPSPEVDAALAMMRRSVGGHLGASTDDRVPAPPPRPTPPGLDLAGTITPPPKNQQGGSQLPGTTQTLQANAMAGGTDQGTWGIIDNAPASAGLLNSLNRGSEYRQSRGLKIAKSPASKTRAFSQEKLDPTTYQDLLSPPEQRPVAANSPPEIGPPIPQDETVDVEMDPMVVRKLDDARILLYRTVVIGQLAYRQGLLVDIPKLMSWLTERGLGDEDGRSLGVFYGGSWGGIPEPDAKEGLLFRHRFAEPFGALGGVMVLNPLPAEGAELYLYALSGLLFLLGTVGLFAVYRMVSLRVSFAERRTDFVSAVTHELKTPITAIRMYAEMLREGMVPSDEKRQQYYETITAESERLSRLIGNVLELGRIERGARSVSLVCADLNPVLEEVRAVLGPHAAKQGFTIDLEVEEGLPPVVFDRDALMQVLFNLVDNALKYARNAEIKRITIAVGAEGDGAVVSIRDRGPGIPPQQLRKVFEPFYRGERELTRTTKGTGIGLSLVKGLAERMGAQVWGKNAPGGGFEVNIRMHTEAPT